MTLRRSLALVTASIVSSLAFALLTASPTGTALSDGLASPPRTADAAGASVASTVAEPEAARTPDSTVVRVAGLRAPAPVIWDLPMAKNERVDHFIRFLTGHNREKTALWLERSGRYGPMTREKLRARQMPEDLTYLALIESGFSPAATSSANAIGMWQFIEETGRRYGLKVTPYLDERRDPVKATDAALTYLQELYKRFGSWYLAAAAYNTGENRVERILRERAGSARGEEALYWTISPFLPRETRDYVPLMLAAGHIGKEPERYGFEDLDYQPLLAFDTVRAPGGVSLEVIAQAAGVAATEVVDLNPHYVQKVTPPGAIADVRIPQGRSPIFELNFPQVASAAQAAAEARVASAAAGRVRAAAARVGAARLVRVRSAVARPAGRSVAVKARDAALKARGIAEREPGAKVDVTRDDAPKPTTDSISRTSARCAQLLLPSSHGTRSHPRGCRGG